MAQKILFDHFMNGINHAAHDFYDLHPLAGKEFSSDEVLRLFHQFEDYNSLNIIEFNKKNRIVSFLDETTNKIYKICTSNKIIVKNLLEDLCNNFPELNYNNRKLMLKSNNLEVRLDSSIYNFIKDDFSTIIIKNGQ